MSWTLSLNKIKAKLHDEGLKACTKAVTDAQPLLCKYMLLLLRAALPIAVSGRSNLAATALSMVCHTPRLMMSPFQACRP